MAGDRRPSRRTPFEVGHARPHWAILQKIIAEWRNRIEATFGEIIDLMELARHGAHTFWGSLPAPPLETLLDLSGEGDRSSRRSSIRTHGQPQA